MLEDFKYLEVLFTSEGRIECEIDRLVSAAAGVVWSMYQSAMVKELIQQARLNLVIYAPTLSYGHELLVMTERSQIQVAEEVPPQGDGTLP